MKVSVDNERFEEMLDKIWNYSCECPSIYDFNEDNYESPCPGDQDYSCEECWRDYLMNS